MNNKHRAERQLEGEESLQLGLTDVYPDAVVKISRDQYSIFEITRMVTETGELQIDPEFQRNPVWTLSQERELVESVLMGIPLPIMYAFENIDGVKQIVDGRQRINALIRFLNNRFALDNLKMLPQFDKKKFKDLQPIYQSKFERHQLSVYIIEPPTPERLKYDIFDRVNRGGTRLNNQEMRHALYFGEATKLLNELRDCEAFNQATGGAIKSKRMRDQYVILRTLSFYLIRTEQMEFNYKSNIDELLAETMQWLNRADTYKLQALKDVFIKAMLRAYEVMGADGFRFQSQGPNRRPINMPLFEVLSFLFASTAAAKIEPDRLRLKIDSLKQILDESGFFKNRVDSSESVDYRYQQIVALIEEIK